MKKKFINVAVFCALAMSTPVFVGCSDYDDDISNLQSQVDELKKVNVSSSEALSALNQALEGLKSDVVTLTSGKADQAAVVALQEKVVELQQAIEAGNRDEEIASLSGQIADLIEQVNGVEGTLSENAAKLEAQKKELEGKISDLNKQLQAAIDNKADQTTVAGIRSELDEATGKLVGISNELETVKLWVDKNGESLAKLTAQVSKIESLIEAIDKGGDTLGEDILAQIAALPELAAKADATDKALTELKTKITTDNNAIIGRLTTLETWKTNILTSLVEGTEYASLTAALNDIKAVKDLIGSGVNPEDPTVLQQMAAIQGRLDKLENVIQSIVYVPSNDSEYLLESSVLKLWSSSARQYVAVAQKKDAEIKFRISPAAAVKKFAENYELSFDGHKLRAAGPVVLVGDPVIDESKGTVTYQVNTNIEENSVFAVCAILKAKDADKNATDLTSTYFKVKSGVVEVNKMEVANANSTVDKFAFKPTTPSSNDDQIDYTVNRMVKGYKDGNLVVNDMSVYDIPVEISYRLSDNNYFQIVDGVLSLKEPSQAMVGKTVTVTPQVKVSNLTFTCPAYTQVEVARRVVDYTIETPCDIAWNKDIQYYPISEADMIKVINQTELSTGDFNALLSTAETANEVYLTTGKNIGTNQTDVKGNAIDATANKLYVAVKAGANMDAAKALSITLAESNSTTQTSSYVFRVNTTAMTYPTHTIEVNPVRWGDDNKITFTPILNNYDHPSSIDTKMDLNDLFTGYATLVNEVETKLGGEVIMTFPGLPAGVTASESNMNLAFDKTKYTGAEVKIKVEIKYGNKVCDTKEATIDVRKVSGKWTSPASLTVTANDVNKEFDASKGFSWADFRGKVMWKDGATVSTGSNKDFATDPFALYGLSKPKFTIVDDLEDYLTVDHTGKIKFTDKGKQAPYASDYKVTLRVTADSPWGVIDGMANDQVELTVIVPKGTNK